MNTLVIFPGLLDSVFLKNEYEYYIDKFDRVVALTNPGNKTSFNKISKKYHIEYKIVKTVTLKSIFVLLYRFILKNRDRKLILSELKRAKTDASMRILIKRFGYIIMYMCYAINSEKSLNKMIGKNECITIYSFWLSRGAFATAYLNNSNIVKKISRAHRYDLYEEENSADFLPFRKYIKDRLDSIFFISEDGRQYFSSCYGNKVDSYFVNYLGTKKNNDFRKIIKNKNYVTLVSCSNIVDVKRLDLIILALKEIKIPFKWYHIGDGNLKQEMETLASNELKKDTYVFLGKVRNDKILDLYKKLDVDFLINLSDSEGVPVSIMEAMSVGIPTIVRNVGGCSEIVDNTCGLLLENNYNNSQIQEFIKMRITNADRYKELSNNAFLNWENNFNADSNYTKFADLLVKE